MDTIKVESISLTFVQKLILTVFTGAFTGGIVALVFYIWDSSNWKIAPEANGFINVILLMAFGILIANVYYRYQYKKQEGKNLEISEEFVVITVNQDTMLEYTLETLLHIKLDQQFYFLFGLKRLTLGFKVEYKSKLHYETFLLKKEQAESINDSIKALKYKA